MTTAAAILVKSRGLTLILQRILAVGNVMNAGTKKGDARGIRLGSLLAIVKTKGRDLCGNQPLVRGVLTKLQPSPSRSNRSRFG